MFRVIFYILSFSIVCSGISFAQQSVKDLNAKRKQIENNISRLNSLIAESDKSRKVTADNLTLTSQKLGLKISLFLRLAKR